MKTRVAHLTTAHARDEVRIFRKECTSLVKCGYDVHLIVADGKGFDQADNIARHDVGCTRSRFQRVFIQPWKIYSVARQLHASVYHLHEPELLFIAPLLKRMGAHVIYDSHEDVPRAVMGRDWIHPYLRQVLSLIFELFENCMVGRISAVVAATPYIASRFSKTNSQTVTVNNFPLLSEISEPVTRCGPVETVCYIGGISHVRGLFEMIQALDLVDARLVLAGPFENMKLEFAARKLSGWSKVDYRGIVTRSEVYQIMEKSFAGLLVYYPEPNHVSAQPNKMFEYMSAGIPVIASNFPLWREIIEGNECGICVDPFDKKAIANAINYIMMNPEVASRMGQNGRQVVLNRYNWAVEEQKLLRFYAKLI